jgi:hypothetical protein
MTALFVALMVGLVASTVGLVKLCAVLISSEGNRS